MKTRGQAKKELEAVPMDVDKPSYDILEWFPIGYCEDVFKYLDGKAIKQASGVNKEWRKFCNEKKQAAKLKVVFEEYGALRLNRKSVDMILRSKRKHQNIEFRNISRRFLKYIPEILEARAGCWKSVTFDSCINLNQEIWCKVLQAIEPSIEEFSATTIFFSDSTLDVPSKWKFPCLKKLHVVRSSPMLCKAFVQCSSLVKLFFESSIYRPIGIKATLLQNNRNIDDLAVTVDELSLEDLKDFKFKLKKLSLSPSFQGPPSQEIVKSFLETQAETLKSVEIRAGLNRESLQCILSMPGLTSLTTNVRQIEEAITDQAQTLPANTTIASLELQGWHNLGQNSFEILISALTNLKHFKCYETDEFVLRTLAREVPALETLETEKFRINRLPEGEIFPNMTELKVEKFYRDLEEPTGDGNFETLIRENMRAYFRNMMLNDPDSSGSEESD